MTPIEIMALALIILSVLKIAFFLVSPQIWFRNVSKKIYGNPTIFIPIVFIIAAVGMYYLSKTVSIIEFFGVAFVVMFIMLLAFLPYGRELLSAVEPEMGNRKKIWKKSWLTIIIWFILIIWAVYKLVTG